MLPLIAMAGQLVTLQLIVLCCVFLENFIVSQADKNFPPVIEPEVLITSSQELIASF
jgi:hypothetical protein